MLQYEVLCSQDDMQKKPENSLLIDGEDLKYITRRLIISAFSPTFTTRDISGKGQNVYRIKAVEPASFPLLEFLKN